MKNDRFLSRSSSRPRRRARRAGAVFACLAAAGSAAGQCSPQWSGLGSTTTAGEAYGLAVTQGNPSSIGAAYLVAGGAQQTAGPVLYKRVALWDGWSWRVPGGGLGLALAAYDVSSAPGPPGLVRFYAGGQFGQAGTVPVNNIALWDAGEWFNPGGGISSGYILRLFWCDAAPPLGPALYVGGMFGDIGDPARGLTRWDGVSWSAVGGGISNTSPGNSPMANAFALYDDDGPGPRSTALYIGGSLRFANGILVNNIGRWDGVTWEPVGGGAGPDLRAMTVFDHDGAGPARESLFIGGAFSSAGGVEINGLGRWDGQAWHAIPGWIGAAPSALAVFDDDGPGPNKSALYVAGISISAAGVANPGKIVKWDGEQWHGLDGGVSGPLTPQIFALEVFDEDGPGPNPGGLYAAGYFATAGGIPAPLVARWGCPLPPRCDANCNKDFHPATGQPILSVQDFGCFQTRFVFKDPSGDCNEDGELTVADFGCFQTKFVTGCP